MNVLLFDASERVGPDSIHIHGERVTHLHKVLHSRVGDTLKVGEVGGQLGTGVLRMLDDSSAQLAITLNQLPPEKLPLSVILALPRPKMLRRILRAIAELGVESLHLINSYRVEKSYWQTPALNDDVVTNYFLEGLSQSGDTQLPEIHLHKRFKPFAQDTLPDLLTNRQALLLHPGAAHSCPVGVTDATTVCIGPEGGFIPFEVSLLEEAGCRACTLGPRVLRVEHAVYTTIARLSAL